MKVGSGHGKSLSTVDRLTPIALPCGTVHERVRFLPPTGNGGMKNTGPRCSSPQSDVSERKGLTGAGMENSHRHQFSAQVSRLEPYGCDSFGKRTEF